MPELPEVETICRGLKRTLTGARFRSVLVREHRLRQPIPTDLSARAVGSTIQSITRRAKYILLQLSSGDHIVIHLGMSGRLLIKHPPYLLRKHDHVLFEFDDNQSVIYHDPRRFGLVDIQKSSKLKTHPLFRALGLEPLTKSFNGQTLRDLLTTKNTCIKSALMNQHLVVGVGNIYASEALYAAGINPKRSAQSLTDHETASLAVAVKKVLTRAIKSGGSSLRDYVNAEGKSGDFQNRFSVYDQEGKICKKCHRTDGKKILIQRCVIQGRSSFFCPHHQKEHCLGRRHKLG